MKRLLLGLVIIAIIGIGCFLFYREGSLPVDKGDTSSKPFVIKPGEGLNSITKRLSTEGFVRSRVVFYLTVKQLGIERKIQAGEFKLSPSMSAKEVAEELTHGTVDEWVKIIEGLRKEEIAAIVSKQFDFNENDFNAITDEGYLFPDTYLVPKNSSAKDIVDILTTTFNKKVTPDILSKGQKNGMTKEQLITFASIIEREGRSKEAKQQIANILMRRIKEGMPLQVDATVQYALGYQPNEKSWWKKYLTLDDLKFDSPYNTYTHPGLPPGPICSPGLDAINAAANADPSTPYLFYITGNDNKMHYAKTSEEHERNIQKYIHSL
jgi:UPF0755 protein